MPPLTAQDAEYVEPTSRKPVGVQVTVIADTTVPDYTEDNAVWGVDAESVT